MNEQSLQQEVKRYAGLSEIILTVSRAKNLDNLLTETVEKIYNIFEFDRCWLGLANEDYSGYHFQNIFSVDDHISSNEEIYPIDSGVCGWVINNQQMFLSLDWQPGEGEISPCKEETLKSVLCLPLQISAQTIGAIVFAAKKADHFQIEDLEMAVTFTIHMALAIDRWKQAEKLIAVNKELENRVKQRTQELEIINQALQKKIFEGEQIREQLQISKKSAEDAYEAKGQFLANMSHELRTPLNSIIGYLSLVLKKHLSKETMPHKLLQRAYNSSKDLLNLINNILDLSKIEAGKMSIYAEDFSLENLLVDCYREAEGLVVNKDISIKTQIEKNLPKIKTDFILVKQLVKNLLSNAVKFTTKGYVSIATKQQPGFIFIEIEDTGCGIPQEKLQTIYESFSQVDSSTKKKFGGTGLGLTISKQICDLLGISIKIKPRIPHGTIFILGLPLKYTSRNSLSTSLRRDNAFILSPQLIKSFSIAVSQEFYEILRKKFSPCQVHSITDHINFTNNIQLFILAKKHAHLVKEIQSTARIVICAENGEEKTNVTYISPTIDELFANCMAALTWQHNSTLIVDDNKNNLTLMEQVFAGSQLNIRTASSGIEALEIIRNELPEVVLMDLAMPNMDGFETLEQIDTNKTIVIACSAFVDKDFKHRAFSMGCKAYMTKPIDPDLLIEYIQKTKLFSTNFC